MPGIRNGLRYIWTLATALASARWRAELRDAWRLERDLPRMLDELPLPKLMESLTPAVERPAEPRVRDRDRLREIADAAVAFDVRSPLGLCLRQSLVRYFLLRRAGVPVTICFGARKRQGTVVQQASITGHAWLILRGIPFAEDHYHYRDFTVMYTFPETRQLEMGL